MSESDWCYDELCLRNQLPGFHEQLLQLTHKQLCETMERLREQMVQQMMYAPPSPKVVAVEREVPCGVRIGGRRAMKL